MYKIFRKIIFLGCLICLISTYIKAETDAEKLKRNLSVLENICIRGKDLNSIREEINNPMAEITKIGKQSVPYMIDEFKKKDNDWKYKYLILQQLGLTQDERVIDVIIEALEEGKEQIKLAAINILGSYNNKRFSNHLVRLLADSNIRVKLSAIESLSSLESPDTVEDLLNTLSTEQDYLVNVQLIRALSSFKDKKVVSKLIDVLKHDDNTMVRGTAALALGKIGDIEATEHLINALKDKDSFVKVNAATSLGLLKDDRAVRYLEEALEDKDISNVVSDSLKKITGKEYK